MKQLLYILPLASALFAATANSASLPEHYPQDGFPVSGNLDRVDLASREIVINDMLFYLDNDVTLHSLSSESDSLGRLLPGTKIGAKFTMQGGKQIVTELWMLPGSYDRRGR